MCTRGFTPYPVCISQEIGLTCSTTPIREEELGEHIAPSLRQYEKKQPTAIRRLVACVFHPQVYHDARYRKPAAFGQRKQPPCEKKLHGVLRERLVDLVLVVFGGALILPGSLPFRNYFHYTSVNILIPVEELIVFDERSSMDTFKRNLSASVGRCLRSLRDFMPEGPRLSGKYHEIDDHISALQEHPKFGLANEVALRKAVKYWKMVNVSLRYEKALRSLLSVTGISLELFFC